MDARAAIVLSETILSAADFLKAKEETALKKQQGAAGQNNAAAQNNNNNNAQNNNNNPVSPAASPAVAPNRPVIDVGNNNNNAVIKKEALGPPEIQPDEISRFEKIGGGCFGEVYRGKCRGIEVAVKVLTKQDLDDKTLADFKKEIDIMAKLNHPNVVLYMGACTQSGNMSIVTEIMPKGNVGSLLKNRKVELSLTTRMKMAKDAALGMTWLHESNPCILHRDMKPANLLIGKDMVVKVCDFGLSVVKPRGEVLRDKDSIPGTPLWMAPEVLMGKGIDEKSDVYSFGIVLWEILTRDEPFSHHDDYVTFKRAVCIKNERPPIPDNCLPSLKFLIEQCWQKDPTQRPSFRDILKMLDFVIVDATINDENARDLWKNDWMGKDEVKWDEFIAKLCKKINVPPPDLSDIKIRCLKAVVAEASKDPTLANQDMVTMEKFGKICDVYGPLTSPTNSILKKVHDILENDWFHGEISKEEAENRLVSAPNGTFLVRLSTTDGRSFTISKVSRAGKLNHQRIAYKHDGEDQYSVVVQKKQKKYTVKHSGSLTKFIEKVVNDLYLKKSAAGSPYRHLFVDRDFDNDATSGYVVDEEDYESDE